MHTPTLHPNTPSSSTSEDILGNITSKILGILESEVFLHQSQELERLFTQFNDALDAKINKAGYDYKDYEQRLFREEDKLEAIVQQDQALRVPYENFLQATEFAPYLKQALWDKILFDRLLELGPPAQEFSESVTISYNELKTGVSIPYYPKIIDLPNNVSAKELGEVFLKIENTPGVLAIDLMDNNLWGFQKDQLQSIFSHLGTIKRIILWDNNLGELCEPKLQSIFSHLGNARSIDLRNNRLGQLDEPKLQSIFSHLGNARSIDLSWNDLGKLDEPKLQSIFSYLGNVRSLNLGDNDLCQLDEPSLHAIFSHLGNARAIDLRANDLGQFDEPRLQAIFSYLGSVRSLNLRDNDLCQLDELRLQAIFSHLGNMRSMDLIGNNLGNLDEPRLHTFFSHLSGVRSIDLRYNYLGCLDEPRLHAIFSHLTHIEEVFLESQEEVSKLESIFPNLKGKLKVTESL